MRKSQLIVGSAVLALASGAAVTMGLSSSAERSRAITLQAPPGRGREKPWWESIAITFPTPSAPTTTFTVPADLLFETDSATIDSGGRAELALLAQAQLSDAKSIVVAGATDSRGTRVHNLELSQARADAATTVLVQAGINPLVIRTEAWADTHPAADENGTDPATAQARNRRVELLVTK